MCAVRGAIESTPFDALRVVEGDPVLRILGMAGCDVPSGFSY